MSISESSPDSAAAACSGVEGTGDAEELSRGTSCGRRVAKTEVSIARLGRPGSTLLTLELLSTFVATGEAIAGFSVGDGGGDMSMSDSSCSSDVFTITLGSSLGDLEDLIESASPESGLA